MTLKSDCEHVWVTYWSTKTKQCIDCKKVVSATDKAGVKALTEHKRQSSI